MNNRIEHAGENYKKHYNCAQSVSCAYCDLIGLDETTLFRLSEGFGGGMGMQEVCGAVTGMFFILSYLNSDGQLNNSKTKAATYKLMREAAEKFKTKYGSIICREILQINPRKTTRCLDKILSAATILDEYINKKTSTPSTST